MMSMKDAEGDGAATESALLFATPVYTRYWSGADDLNAYLHALFLHRERTEGQSAPGYSNVGGWHSPIDLQESWDQQLWTVLERCRALATDATARLIDTRAQPARYKYTLSAWANVSRAGDYNAPHAHTTAWSAVYYVSVPPGCCTDTSAGALELIDPRATTAIIDLPGDVFAARHVIRPRAGLMVLFPGSVMHFVHPFRGAGERISIACDLALADR